MPGALDGFKLGYYVAISLLVWYLYIAYKLLGQRPLLSDMGDWYAALYSLTIVIFGLRRMYVKRTGYIARQTIALMAFQLFAAAFCPAAVRASVPGVASPACVMGHAKRLPRPIVLARIRICLGMAAFHLQRGNRRAHAVLAGFGNCPDLCTRSVHSVQMGQGRVLRLVCPCGAMAETLGDEYRTRALHGPAAKKAENWGQAVLWFAALVTLASLAAGTGSRGSNNALEVYGIIIDVVLAGVIGLGLYFHFSGRVWCRFFCPLAALMHIYARFSPYRIMANKKRCISCNICTKVCHIGIDVMNFANKGIP